MYSNPCAHRVRAFVGSSNRTVYSRISICTHGSIHICHRRGATGHAYYTHSRPRSRLFIDQLDSLYPGKITRYDGARRSARNRPFLPVQSSSYSYTLRTPISSSLSPLGYPCNRLSKMLENICTNNSEYFNRRGKGAPF